MTDDRQLLDSPRSLDVAIIGAGPTASSLFERFVANAPELLGAGRCDSISSIRIGPAPAACGGRTSTPGCG